MELEPEPLDVMRPSASEGFARRPATSRWRASASEVAKLRKLDDEAWEEDDDANIVVFDDAIGAPRAIDRKEGGVE